MSRPRLAPVLVLALDGATFDVIDPLIAAGRLPNLARWIEAGGRTPLRSTTPPVTFPAWSSFLTGHGPGRHGILDFTQKVEGAYRIRFVNAADRCGRSLFRRVCDAGGRVLVLGMPATFPPEPLDGLLVCGFDAPVSAGTDARSASDPALYRAIAERAGPWMRPDLDEAATGEAFHERAVATLLDRIARKERFALEALEALRARDGDRPELMTVVFSESDTVGHHYWRDHDPASPRHDPGASEARKGAVAAVYERLDLACGRLRAAYGQDALCCVVSDHGMGGAGRHVVHLNRFLEEQGFLHRLRGAPLDAAARRTRDAALRLLPPRLAQRIFRRLRGSAARLESAARFGGIDFAHTTAFSEEANTQPGVWINRRGREARGCVRPREYEAVRDEVMEALREWRLPGGGPVVARAARREDVYEGPFVDRAPDIVLELALDEGHGLSLVPTPWAEGPGPSVRTLAPAEYGGGRGRGMNGTHRRHGVFVASGGERDWKDLGRCGTEMCLVDVAPTLLDAMGVPWAADGGADGRVHTPRPYTDEEDALVRRRLQALGYLD